MTSDPKNPDNPDSQKSQQSSHPPNGGGLPNPEVSEISRQLQPTHLRGQTMMMMIALILMVVLIPMMTWDNIRRFGI
jgi:hypothetical protein